jgi:hypothetical protein
VGRTAGVFRGVEVGAAVALGCALGAVAAFEMSVAGCSCVEDICAASSGCSGASLVAEASSRAIFALTAIIPTITIRRAIPE